MRQTPVVQFRFNWKHVSVIAGLARMNCLVRFHDGATRSAQVVAFLKALRPQLRRKLLVNWDGLQAHRSRLVRKYLASTNGAVQVAFLPPYAPDCNPVECLTQASRPVQLRATRDDGAEHTQSAQHRRVLEAGQALVVSAIA